jgi:hypothetical protein
MEHTSPHYPENSKIRIGQVFRVGSQDDNLYRSLEKLTAGVFPTGCDIQKGMFFYADVQEPGEATPRQPAFLFYSNPFKSGTEETPWVDIVEPDFGYALFHGDNRQGVRGPLESRGNAKFAMIQQFYRNPKLRMYAPPILLFAQADVHGNRKGFRRFAGYGVPVRSFLVSQKEKNTDDYFTNLVLELALFKLDDENEIFDWSWIDARRNASLTARDVLARSPRAWQEWVRFGDEAVERCRRRVARKNVVSELEQKRLSSCEAAIIEEITNYYAKNKHSFEALASFVACRIIGPNCERAWVTRRSGDGGFDFVGRLDVGDPGAILGRTPIIVLGQAKCLRPSAAVSGLDIARLVARLQRGWIGVFVTTAVYSRPAQIEVAEDKYPVILINGQRLARELQKVIVSERLQLRELLEREDHWYNSHVQPLHPSRVLDQAFFGTDFFDNAHE